MFDVDCPSVMGDILYSICHVTSQDHMIEGSWDVMGNLGNL